VKVEVEDDEDGVGSADDENVEADCANSNTLDVYFSLTFNFSFSL
jgi:hypothetical protein